MMLLETDLAIFKRLTGYPLDSKGYPKLDENGVPVNRECIAPPGYFLVPYVLDPATNTMVEVPGGIPSYGIRVPMTKPPFKGQRGLTSRDPDAVRAFEAGFDSSNFRQVPVFDQNMTGRKFDDVWPCVTFRWNALEFQPKTYIFHDPFVQQDTRSIPVTIQSRGHEDQHGYSSSIIRPHPESWDVLYTITAWSKSQIEMALMCSQIMQLFPGKGGLKIQFQSGETHTCDMLLRSTHQVDAGDGDPVSTGPEEQRAFGTAFVYVVETYMDNTTNQFGSMEIRTAPTIQERIAEIEVLVEDAISQYSSSNLVQVEG